MTWALITGGTSGIGAAYARALAARGDDLVLVARDEARLQQSAADLSERYGVTVETLAADLAVRADIDRVAARLEATDRPIDTFINNAGFGLHTKLLDPDTEIHERAIDVMCTAVLILGGAAGRAMKARGRGRIANTSSISSWISQGNYSAIKAWVSAYSESLRNELHGHGVYVTAVCPGWVRTEFHQRAGIRANLPSWVWIDADRLATDSLKDINRGKAYSIPTIRWKLAWVFVRFGPRSATRWFSRLLTRSRD